MIRILNNGPEIESTDYWSSPHAHRGLMYLSGNAGALRLLVPPKAEHYLAEMNTATSIRVARQDKVATIVFDDGSDEPFAVAIDLRQCERALRPGTGIPFTIWTARGKVAAFLADVTA